MKNNSTSNDGPRNPELGGGGKGKLKLSLEFTHPEPTLWNSELGRRSFLKKAGGATAATVLLLQQTRMEARAGGDNPYYGPHCPKSDQKIGESITYTGTITFSGNPNAIEGNGKSKFQNVKDAFDNAVQNSSAPEDTMQQAMGGSYNKGGVTDIKAISCTSGVDSIVPAPTDFTPDLGNYSQYYVLPGTEGSGFYKIDVTIVFKKIASKARACPF